MENDEVTPNEDSLEEIPQELEDQMIKAWYKSKTIIGNAIVAVPGVLFELYNQLSDNTSDILSYLKSLNMNYYITAIIIIAILNIINRKYTTNPIK
jgi:hypothetical protein